MGCSDSAQSLSPGVALVDNFGACAQGRPKVAHPLGQDRHKPFPGATPSQSGGRSFRRSELHKMTSPPHKDGVGTCTQVYKKQDKTHDKCAVNGEAGAKRPGKRTPSPRVSSLRTSLETHLHTHSFCKINPNSTLISIQKHLEVFIRITSRSTTFITRAEATIVSILECSYLHPILKGFFLKKALQH